MNPPELVVFDMAGTTVEDRGQVPAAFSAALAANGIEVSPAQLNAVRGASKRQAVFNLTPEGPDRSSRAAAIYTTFTEALATEFAKGVQAMPEAVSTFEWLRSRSAKIALNTGFDRDVTKLLLNSLNWGNGIVDAVVCGDDVPLGRPAPYLIFRCLEATGVTSVHRVAAIGDTVLDLQAGHNAGIAWNIGVLSGAHSREQLVEQPHTHLLATVGELSAIWPDD